jgi:hypothetical protein
MKADKVVIAAHLRRMMSPSATWMSPPRLLTQSSFHAIFAV